MKLGWACILLTLAAAVPARGDAVAECSGTDVTALRDTLRQSACKLVPGRGNDTQTQTFREYVYKKNGETNTYPPFFTFASLFRPSPALVWCRSPCSLESASIRWCVNIAYLDRVVETCIRLGEDGRPVTNSTCEAELVGVPSVLDLPSECPFAGDIGCLAMSNLDWFYEGSLMTCKVESPTCNSTSFTTLLTYSGLATPPEFELFPSSPFSVLTSNQLVLHVELSSPTDRITVVWQHKNLVYSHFIFEDPFCVGVQEECQNDTHPGAAMLRQERIRAYRTTRVVQLEGCQSSFFYRLEIYLIIDHATVEDGGEYIFNATVIHAGASPITVPRTVNVSVGCEGRPPDSVNCSTLTPSVYKGNNIHWECTLTDIPRANLVLLLNKTIALAPSNPGITCRNRSEVVFYVEPTLKHTCYSSFKVVVWVCSAGYSLVGEYSVRNSSGDQVPGSSVFVKVVEEGRQNILNTDYSSDEGNRRSQLMVYTTVIPVSLLVVVGVVVLIVLLVVLRSRKRTRDRRVLTRVHSPSLKEVAFLKEEGEAGLHSPSSPGNCSLGDPLEFPRNRLYIYSNKILGEGSFGRVLQAKAQGIVPGMPDRNIVAIKTTKDNATSIEREELLAELQLMKVMEPHENILNLLGHCTTPGGPVCLIVEYASYGNLRDFLRQCEEVVLSLNHMPHIPRNRSRTRTFSASSCSSAQPLISRQDSVFTPGSGHTHFVFPSSPTGHISSGSASSDSGGGGKMTAHHPDAASVPLAHSVAPIGHDYLNTKGLVYMEDVHNFALQIACGLKHIASMQIVHCDLAARNVLIAEGFVLKIADFGLARDISEREMYKKNPRGKIPVKWTAPEALEKRIFTVKSDVWSYGVLLWELFTYGHTPYPEFNLGTSYEPFIEFLKSGNRMQQPESCPPSFYDLMLDCWHLDPSHRPSPHDIVAQLTPSDSIFDDADSELNTTQNTVSTSSSGGHQSSQE